MTDNVKVLEKSVAILNIIGESKEPLGLAEISKLADMPKTTTRRILTTLVNFNFLEFDESQRYKLGLQILKLGTSMLNSSKLKDCVHDYAKVLRDKTNFTVFVGVLNGFEIIYIDKVAASITMTADVGYRAPAHCTAIGQVLLAHVAEETLDRLLLVNELVKKTEQTITDINQLKSRLRQVREQGYAIDEREHKNEIRCIASPIKDHTGKAVAAISVSSVLSLYDENRMEEYITNIKATAKAISQRLGYTDDTNFEGSGVL